MQFAHPYEKYEQNLDIILSYVDTAVTALKKVTDITTEEAEEFVRSQPEFEKINDVKINFLLQDKQGNRKKKQTPIVKYLDNMAASDNVITPMFTSFLSKDKKEAPQPKFIKIKMAERKRVKEAAGVAKNAKDMVRATILTGVQNAIKILINSFSGAALSAHNPFYSGSLHQVLCAMCRVSTAIATSLIERMLGGVRFYHTPALVSDDLMQTITKLNRSQTILAVKELNLKYPTKDDCLAIIRRSYEDYWWDTALESEFMPILDKMDEVERAGFCYTLDFYNLFKLNPESLRGMIDDLTFNDYMSLDTDCPWVIPNLSGDEKNLLTGLIGEDIKGTSLKDNLKEGAEKRPYINALAHRLKNKLLQYKSLSDAFFLTPILPLDVGNQDNAIRHATSLGDTDSSIFTTMLINEQYYGKAEFTPDQNPVTEFAIFLVNGVIEHGLNTFTGQMNVHVDDRSRLVMKNEFGFTSLQMTPYKKTYFAQVRSCEGQVYADDNPSYEIKGMRFHAGKSNRDMVNELHDWMRQIPITLSQGGKVDRGELLRIIEDLEDDIRNGLDRKDNHKFGALKIKEYSAYSNPKSQEWAKHNLWNWTFGDTHGKGGEEGYASYKLPLKFEGGIAHFMENTTPKIRKGFEKYINYVTDNDPKKFASKNITYIPIPMDSMGIYGIPEELKPLIDIEKAIKRALDPHLLMLANMGIVLFKKDRSSGANVVLQKRVKDILI